VRARTREEQSAAVPEVAKQAEESRDPRDSRWDWVEPVVWTERMLAALENGVKGGRWYSLMDKVYAERTLWAAWERVKRNGGSAGVDRQSVAAFEARAGKHLASLARDLREGTYRPQPIRRTWIPKPGSRERRGLGIPTVRDRVVQSALKLVVEPIFEVQFAQQSYGFRPGRGCKDALRRVEELLKEGATWVVDCDLRSYFDSIPHEALLAEMERQIGDGKVMELLRAFLNQKVMEGLNEWAPETGTPQGAVISPLMANVYLDSLDHEMGKRGWQLVRYADDAVCLCKSQAEAETALAAISVWVQNRGLALHPEKTKIVDTTKRGGFDFLGYHFERGMKWPRKQSVAKFRVAIRARTSRKSGDSLSTIVTQVNLVIRGWFEYFKHSQPSTFEPLDGFVRRRLRSILCRRNHIAKRGWGFVNQRWPKAYFVELGLFTMSTARASARQSRRGNH